MLYRLSYASGGSKSFQAQYFPDPFLIVRDNYLRYHKGYWACNRNMDGPAKSQLLILRIESPSLFFPTIFHHYFWEVFHVERLTLLYLQYCQIAANIIRTKRGENKVDFQATRRVGESGIFVEWMFTIGLWLSSLTFFLFYE